MRTSATSPARERIRRTLLVSTFVLALLLLGVDRYAAATYRPQPQSTEIVLYTTTWCGFCAALRMQLRNAQVPFVERDVEKSLAGVLGFWTLHARGVPVSVIGPRVVLGYREAALESALADLGYTVDLVPAGAPAALQ